VPRPNHTPDRRGITVWVFVVTSAARHSRGTLGGAIAENRSGARNACYHATKVNCISTFPTFTRSPSLSSVLAVKG
jgi:hypothetical protein